MNETMQTIHSLRSIHGNFSEQEISKEDLTSIIQAALRAANASARQSYSLVIVEDKQDMKTLFGYIGSKAIVFCIDFTRLNNSAKYLGHSFDSTDIIGFITGGVDTALAAQTSVIAAKSLGIDSLITNGIHRTNLDKVYDLLNLPKQSCFPLIAVVYGYPNAEPAYQKGRLDHDSIIHYGNYNDSSATKMKEVVTEYDNHRKHLGMIDNWDELGFKHYLDWFFTKWTQKPSGDKENEVYRILKETGFLRENF